MFQNPLLKVPKIGLYRLEKAGRKAVPKIVVLGTAFSNLRIMEIADIFNRVLHKQGGYLDIKHVEETFKEWNPSRELIDFAEHLLGMGRALVEKHMPRYKKLPKIHLAYINNKNLGAVADKDSISGEYIIGVYFGSIPVLSGFFSKMLTNPGLFTWIDPTTPEESTKVNNPFITNWQVLQEFLESFPEIRIVPNSENRRVFVQNLTLIAVMYLVMHELGHIVRGHVDYLKSLPGNSSDLQLIDDTSILQNSTLSGLERQALEADADNFSIFHMVPHTYQVFSVNRNKESLKRALEVWAFTICSIFRLFGLIPYPSAEDAVLSKHPPAALRMLLAFDDTLTATRAIPSRLLPEGIIGSEVNTILINTITLVQNGLASICDDKEVLTLGSEPIAKASAELVEYRIKMEPIYNSLMQRLSKFRFEFTKP